MSKTDDALASQTTLLNNFAQIIRNLIQRAVTAESDRDKAVTQVGELLGADQATAAAILADSPHIQALIDEAAASSLPDEAVPLAS
ncbi:MAG: hypothetical protein V7L00_20520 [Nostoc sp.]|uniref:hypothetical protein n=1 Tax=Nostoc sp. TaxID=1180 RepID=UPI002FF963A6